MTGADRRTERQARGERGANLVEAALCIPLLLLVLVGIVDLGGAFHTYIAVVAGAREGARYVSGQETGDAACMQSVRDRVAAEAATSRVNLVGAPPAGLGAVITIEWPEGQGPGPEGRGGVHVPAYPTVLGLGPFPMGYAVSFRVR